MKNVTTHVKGRLMAEKLNQMRLYYFSTATRRRRRRRRRLLCLFDCMFIRLHTTSFVCMK